MTQIKKMILIALGSMSLSATATPVIVGGDEWRQVTDTTGHSWSQIAQVCDPVTGMCNGSLGAADLSGWSWASVDEVKDLFNAITGQLGGISNISVQYGSTWAPVFLSIFSPTYTNGSVSGIYGWSRTPTPSNNNTAYRPYVYNSSGWDYMNSHLSAGASSSWSGQGAWLVRNAQSVPEPSTLLLLGIGLIGVCLSNYGNSKQSNASPLRVG